MTKDPTAFTKLDGPGTDWKPHGAGWVRPSSFRGRWIGVTSSGVHLPSRATETEARASLDQDPINQTKAMRWLTLIAASALLVMFITAFTTQGHPASLGGVILSGLWVGWNIGAIKQ